MNNKSDENKVKNPFLVRFKPDYRYRNDKKTEIKLTTTYGGFNSKDESITDKEAYAINFASERGDISSLGASREGVYSIQAGQPYDPNKDFSYLNRPDITLVDLDSYIEQFKHNLENADKNLVKELENELLTLKAKKEQETSQVEKGESGISK